MEIKWSGNNFFSIKSDRALTVIDPLDTVAEADIAIFTVGTGAGAGPNTFVVDWPGEFESKEIIMHVIPVSMGKKEQRILSCEIDGIRLCNLGSIEAPLSDDIIAEIGDIDVLMLPLTMKASDALSLVEEIDPRLVILSLFDKEGATPLGQFLKEIGKAGLEPKDKIVIKAKSALDAENIEYAYLSP